MISQILFVGIGGLFGAISRYWVNIHFSSSKLFPLGTFLVNTTGSFLMGLLAGSKWIPLPIYLLLGTGFLGAYTTFSAFKLELFILKKNHRNFMFFLYLTSSYLLGFLSAALGWWIVKSLAA